MDQEEEKEKLCIVNPRKLPDTLFIDWGPYYELKFPQRSQPWHEARKDKVTASIFATAAGLDEEYKTRKQLLYEMAGLAQKQEPGYISARAMKKGTDLEPYVIQLYETEKSCRIVPRKLVVPKWCLDIGASVDGYNAKDNYIIEVKCPTRFTAAIALHSEAKSRGKKFDRLYRKHISESHYAQMQGGMAILDVEYCDYVVYEDKTGRLVINKVRRNRDYWENTLFPKLLEFVAELKALKAKYQPETDILDLHPNSR